MSEPAYPTLFRSIPARFESDFPLEESVRRLSAIVKQSMFDGLFEHCALGRVSVTRVTIQRATPLSRGNRLLFKGSFEQTGDAVCLVGRFTWPLAIRIGTGLYMAFCLFLAAAGLLVALRGVPEAALMTVIGLGIAGLMWVSPWFTRKDVLWISEVIQGCLSPAKTPPLQSTTAPAPVVAFRVPNAILVLQVLLGLAALGLLGSAVSGIAALAQGPNGVVIVRHDVWSRSAAVVGAALLGAAVYGIRRRLRIVWYAGMAALPVGGLGQIIQMQGLMNVQLPNQPPQIGTAVMVFMSTAVIVFVVLVMIWWNRQRGYFMASTVDVDDHCQPSP